MAAARRYLRGLQYCLVAFSLVRPLLVPCWQAQRCHPANNILIKNNPIPFTLLSSMQRILSPLQLFILRKFIEYELAQIGLGSDDVYFCSLSSATVVYKGQLTPEQVRACGGDHAVRASAAAGRQ